MKETQMENTFLSSCASANPATAFLTLRMARRKNVAQQAVRCSCGYQNGRRTDGRVLVGGGTEGQKQPEGPK